MLCSPRECHQEFDVLKQELFTVGFLLFSGFRVPLWGSDDSQLSEKQFEERFKFSLLGWMSSLWCMQGTIWSHLCGDVPPEDALKKGFLGNNSVAPEAGALPGSSDLAIRAPSPSSHQAVMGMGGLHALRSETLMEILASLNIPGVCFGCCCC